MADFVYITKSVENKYIPLLIRPSYFIFFRLPSPRVLQGWVGRSQKIKIIDADGFPVEAWR